MLHLVSTPIGNLEDITYRAVRTLKEVDTILCEDTRESRKLTNRYEIKTKLISYHAQNHQKVGARIIEGLKNGKNMALISDSGTPLINDPGVLLVKECIQAGIQISPIPGASAFLSALVCSGLPTKEFSFWGFIPHKKGRETFFKRLNETDHTVIFYESCHRIIKCLTKMQEHCGEKHVVVGREITKKFEEFVRGTPEEVLEYFENHVTKGEFVVVVGKNK